MLNLSQKKAALVVLCGLALIIPSATFAFVPLICDLCTIGVVAGLALSRYLGVDDSVIGVWIGACLATLIVMTNNYLEKKNIRFRFRNTLIALSYIVFSVLSFSYAGVIGIYRNTFFHSTSIFADKILVSSIVGGGMLMFGSIVYQWLKARNGGRAHFPFEKVVLPIAALLATSAIFYFVTLR